MHRERTVIAALFVIGCGGRQYADDPDLVSARAAFRCDAPASPSSRRACHGMARFEAAGPVESYPAEGITVYLGRSDCSSDPDRIVFSIMGLGSGTPPLDVDDAHRPQGVVYGQVKVVAWSDVRRQAASSTLEKLEEGYASPNLTKPQRDDGVIPPSWDGWRDMLKQPPPTPKPTALSDGKSLLEAPGHTPAFWDDAEPSSAFAYIREIDDELIYVRTADDQGVVCVRHVLRLPDNG